MFLTHSRISSISSQSSVRIPDAKQTTASATNMTANTKICTAGDGRGEEMAEERAEERAKEKAEEKAEERAEPRA